MHDNNVKTRWEQIKKSSGPFKDKFGNAAREFVATKTKGLPEYCTDLKTKVSRVTSDIKTGIEEQIKDLDSLKDRLKAKGEKSTNVETERKYEVEVLPHFFKKRSKDISKVFSNEAVEISTIRSRSIDNDKQELSFKLRLLTATGEDISDTILSQTKRLIVFFKIYLSQEESFMINIKVPKESSELYNNCCKTNSDKTVEEFVNNAPPQVLLQGITIILQTNVKNINLDNLHQIESFLNEKLEHAERTENEEQSLDTLQIKGTESEDKKRQSPVQQKKVQNKQIVTGSFGCNLTNGNKQVTRASLIVAAMRENVSWFRSLFQPLNFFSKVQFFPQQPLKPPTQKQKALTYHPVPQDQKCAEKDQEMGTTRSHTDYFKANRKKKLKNQTKELLEEERQTIIQQAQCDARVAIIGNLAEHKGKKLDEIFVEVMSKYKNQDPETFLHIFDLTFNIVYFQDKQLHKILESDEISKVLEMLEIPQPTGKSFCPKEYLQKQVCRKKEQLHKLIFGINTQQPSLQPENISHENRNPLSNETTNPSAATNKAPPATNIAFKSSLKIVFSSKETYFCLFLVAASISMLCLWHLPMGKASILKELVPPKGRESIGLVLNIGLPILLALCILSLAYFIYSEYSAESIEQVSKNDPLSLT
ncbi:hypothetical protein [Wolbachia endosymbiont of Atemnus politus]|uniref:hypothetical protein n=1 Tax=Wolbachia endosymbiont of Atemnus politus TaxID=2682840 RepID=UPI00210320F7|nr:hypothetical protein [Wolbachia endosymbiont of Atemnus politus]